MTLSNIEPLARTIAERIYRQGNASNREIAEKEIAAWVDSHWQCAAAELEAGLINDDGSRVPGANWKLGLAAYIERLRDRPA